MRASSRASKESSTCGTVVNSYVLDPSPDRTPPKAAHEASCRWTSKLDAEPSSYVPNGHQMKVCTLQTTQQQPCIMGFAAQEGVESDVYQMGTADVLEVKDSGIAFVNVQAFSLKQTDCVCTTELTEVS